METKLNELANERIIGFHTVCEDVKKGLLTCQEAKHYIDILTEEYLGELERMGVSFHVPFSEHPIEETCIKVAVQVADLLAGDPNKQM